MSDVSSLRAELRNCENNLSIYDSEIASLKETIDEIAKMLQDSNTNISQINVVISGGVLDLSMLDRKIVSIKTSEEDEYGIIDYTVTEKDLTLQKTIDINGKTDRKSVV